MDQIYDYSLNQITIFLQENLSPAEQTDLMNSLEQASLGTPATETDQLKASYDILSSYLATIPGAQQRLRTRIDHSLDVLVSRLAAKKGGNRDLP